MGRRDGDCSNKMKNVLLLCALNDIIERETGNHTDYERMCDTMAAKTSNLYARIEPEVKEEAESILAALGIPASNAINMFYKQIILNRGIPFEVKIPPARPVNVAKLSETELDAELEKGYADMTAGKTKPAKQAFADIRRDYGL